MSCGQFKNAELTAITLPLTHGAPLEVSEALFPTYVMIERYLRSYVDLKGGVIPFLGKYFSALTPV